MALLALAAVGAGVLFVIRQPPATAASRAAAPWFAPYVDVTLTPTYAFEDPAANPVRGVFLGFIVAQRSAPCQPSWGGYYSLSGAESALNLDERVSQVRAQGGTPMVSFGGRDNSELAVGCQNLAALTAAYRAPVDRYRTSVIDLDIEGAALANRAGGARRAAAIAAAQRQEAARHVMLGVWLTLPVAPQGLTPDGIAAVRSMLASGVRLTGVNVLAMDFGYAVSGDMIQPVERSLWATHAQLASLYRAAHHRLSSSAAWHQLGVTVMIGQNDVANERVTLADAHALTQFVRAHGIGRVSMWSLNRDSECGSVFTQVGVLSNTCSGVTQAPLQFTRIFSRLAGTQTARSVTSVSQAVPQVTQAPVDDPATSPYPIWQATGMYVAGYKVVWHRQIYEAKWFSQDVAPDLPVQSAAQTPWLLIGPVLAGSRAPAPVLFDGARHPLWSALTVYHRGDRVLFDNLPYEAKWYTQGDAPSGTLPSDPHSPWQPLFTVPGEPGAASQLGAS